MFPDDCGKLWHSTDLYRKNPSIRPRLFFAENAAVAGDEKNQSEHYMKNRYIGPRRTVLPVPGGIREH